VWARVGFWARVGLSNLEKVANAEIQNKIELFANHQNLIFFQNCLSFKKKTTQTDFPKR
jgi:hypothetical protein